MIPKEIKYNLHYDEACTSTQYVKGFLLSLFG